MSPTTDITGWSITMTVRQTPLGANTLVKSVGSGMTLTNPTSGVFTVSFPNADTASLPIGKYVFDIRRTDSGHRATIADGTIELKQEITT